MLFFLTILMIILIVILIIRFSSIKLIINNLEITNSNNKMKLIFEGKVGVYLFGKIKLFSIKINNNKTKELLDKNIIKDKIKKVKNNNKEQKQIQKQIIKEILKKLEIENIDLNIIIDTKNIVLTSYLVGIISSIIPNILSRNINNFNSKNHKFKITPLYKNQKYIYIKLKCIISIKIVHIINVYKIGKKYKGGIKNERPSYRKLNVNCYGKY